jgi:hypothetical protein
MKYSQILGVIAAIILMLSGLMNWTWYPDLKEYFTGFYSYNNQYGRPGRVFIVLGILAIVLFLLPKIWAKRWNVFLCAIILAYAVKTFIAFSTCYKGICPEKQAGIWVMLASAGVVMVAALLPDLKVKSTNETT